MKRGNPKSEKTWDLIPKKRERINLQKHQRQNKEEPQVNEKKITKPKRKKERKERNILVQNRKHDERERRVKRKGGRAKIF